MKKQTAPQKLSEALLKLTEKKNIEKITIREIVQECGLSSQTFYNHFSDKYALVLYIYESAGEGMMNRLLNEESYSYRDFILDHLSFYAEHAVFIRNVTDNTSGRESYYVQSSECGIRLFTRFIQTKYSKEELSPEEKAHLRIYLFGCTEICSYWTCHDMDLPMELIADFIVSSLPSSLRKYFE